jgi:hypothetical protein
MIKNGRLRNLNTSSTMVYFSINRNNQIFSFQIIFLRKKDQVLGEGNFGKVCLAVVSLKDPIRDESQTDKDDFEGGSGVPGSGLSRHKHRFSIRGRSAHNTYTVNKSNSDLELNELDKPLLVKGSRLVAVKMVKGKCLFFYIIRNRAT